MALNQDGYRSGQGTAFRVYHISKILRNTAYCGDLTYNARQDRGAREPFTIPGFYPTMIEKNLFDRVQKKLEEAHSSWHNGCSHHYVGTAAKSSRFHYYSCQTYLQKGKSACNAPLLNKRKLENAVLDQIHERVLSTDNVQRYIELAVAATARKQEPTAEEKAIVAAITDADAKLRRWEEALERGLLSLEDAGPTDQGHTPGEGHLPRDTNQVRTAIAFQDRNPADSYRANGYLYQENAKAAQRKKQLALKENF